MIQASLTRAYDATQLSSAFRGKAVGQITAKVEPASDLIVDGQKLSDIERLMIVLAPENWTSPSGETVSVSPPTVVRITAGEEVPSSLEEEQEQTDELRVEFTVSDEKGAMRRVRIDYKVYPVATVATPGDLKLDLSRDSGSLTIPFTDLFAPAWQNDNWVVPSNIALADAPAGVTLGTGSLKIETRDLVAQMDTQFTVTASDVVYPDTVRSASKRINLSVISNEVELLSPPAFVQGFEGGSALEDSNHAVLSDPANYIGLIDPTLEFSLMIDGEAADIETHQWGEGEQAQLVVDVWNQGRSPADGESDARFQSEVMVVERLLEISDTSGPFLTVTVNPTAPDTYPVNGVVVNGRDLNDGLTVRDFEADQMVLIQSPLFTAPTTDLGDDLTYTPPTVVAPDGATVTVTYDLLDAADDSVILAGQTFTTDTLATTIDAGLQGVTVYWRAKFRAAGLDALDVDSAVITIDAAAGYTQTVFNTGTDGTYTGTGWPENADLLFGAWVSRPSNANGRVFDIGNKTRIETYDDGSVNFLITRGNGASNMDFKTPVGVLPASGLTFVGMFFDASTATGTARVGANTYTLTGEHTDNTAGGAFTIFEREGGGRTYRENFADIVIQTSGANTLDDLYNGGTPPDVSGLTAEVILGGSMTAADFNADPPNQLGTIALTSLEADRTFTEVV